MSAKGPHETVHETDVAASPDVVYGIVADATRWPQFFAPSVHVDREEVDAVTERLHMWATGNGVVRAWTSRRDLDPAARTVVFRREHSPHPVTAMTGTWRVKARPDGARLTLLHSFEAAGDDPDAVAWIARSVDDNSRTELANVKQLAESWDRLAELEFAFEDTVRVPGDGEDVYAFLRDVAAWPRRLPHVDRVDLTEEDGGRVQTMAMWTRAKDNSSHLTESVRVCFPGRIVYKQTTTPLLISAHTGEWLVEPDGDAAVVRSRHVVRLNEDAIGRIPAAGTTVASTREFVRASIGANSRATLAHAAAAVR